MVGAVVGTVVDTNYAGSATGTLVISPAAATVVLGPLNFTYDGKQKFATATTTPAGLDLQFLYDNVGTPPVNAVSYVPTEDNQGHLFDFANLEELARGLAAQKLPYECATAFVSTYINGSTEACLGETKRGAFIDQQLGFVDYFASLAAEPHFAARELP